MDSTTPQNVIYLKDLVFCVLRRWKTVLIFALIFALVFGGYKGLTGWRTLGVQPNLSGYSTELAQYELDKAALDRQMENLQESLSRQQEYLDHSVLMTLNPYSYYEATVIVYVDSNYTINPSANYQLPDKTEYMLSAYYAAFMSTDFIQRLAQAAGIDYRYFSELYSVQIPLSSNRVVVTVMHHDNAAANSILQLLLANFTAAKETVTTTIGSHNLHILEQSVSTSANPELLTTQLDANQQLFDLQQEVTALSLELEALKPPAVPQPASKASVLKDAFAFGVLGAVLGAGLVMLYLWISHAVRSKVYSARALCTRTGVKILGCISDRIPACVIDRWLLKLEGRDLTDPASRAFTLAQDIAHRCGQIGQLLVTGDGDLQQRKLLTDALRQAMPGVRVLDQGSILRSADAVDGLNTCDAVLLAEQCGRSAYDKVAAQCQMIADYEKTLLGCVLIGG